nr:glutamate O-methyltransferase [Microvelia americana]
MDLVVDTETPLNNKLCAKFKRSFAYATVTDRLPVIVTGIIDRLVRDKNRLSEESKVKSKEVIAGLAELKYLLQTAKAITNFSSSDVDTDLWNKELTKYQQLVGQELTFYNIPWLFVECYMYRYIHEIFIKSEVLKDYDAFSDKKEQILEESLQAIQPYFKQILEESLQAIQPYFKHLLEDHILDIEPLKTTDIINEFIQLFKLVLWANRVDLSLSSGKTEDCCNPLTNLDDWNEYLLVDDTEKVINLIFSSSEQEKVIDYVLDNSGFEFLSDLCLCDFLTTRCGVDKIRLRCKRMPWFVSDVTRNDIKYTLNESMAKHQSQYCQQLANRWQQYLDKGKWIIEDDVFWTLGLSFNDMPQSDSALYSELQTSNLIIFKGDLNYRKLIQDTNWEPGTKFSQALGDFRPAPLVAVRTMKADTVAGIDKDLFNSTFSKSPDWLISGQYGVIQFDSTK